jgi:hypothetical protein
MSVFDQPVSGPRSGAVGCSELRQHGFGGRLAGREAGRVERVQHGAKPCALRRGGGGIGE